MDTEYKITDLGGLSSEPPSTTGLAPNTVMEHEPFRAVAAAQDGVAAGCRRVVGVWCMSGAAGFHVPDSGTPTVEVASTGSFPDRDVARAAGSILVPRIWPGQVLRARIFYCPGGSVQYEDPAGTWNPGGALGAITLSHTWTHGATTDGPIVEEYELPSSAIEDAAAPTGEATFWHATGYIDVPLRPADIDDSAVALEWAEDVRVTIDLELRGAPRVVAVVVYEQPLRVVYYHDTYGLAVNGQSGVETPQTLYPQTEALDGGTYEEHRFGVAQMAAVAVRQSLLGPAIANLLAWDEAGADYTADVAPISVSSATFVDVLEQTATTYDRDRPGFIVAAAHAQQHALCDAALVLGGTAAVVPARVLVEAYITGAANLATIRVQSGQFEWIDIDVDSLTPGTVVEATGYLESQVTPDHAWSTVQVFAQVDNDTVEITSVSVVFGT